MRTAYWSNVFLLRDSLFNLAISHGAIIRQVDGVNPYFCQITGGGIGLELYKGIPSKLYTPLGYLPICSNYIIGGDRMAIRMELMRDYGITTLDYRRIDDFGVAGRPAYAITRLPWSNEQIPIFSFKRKEDYMPYAQAVDMYNRMANG